MEEKLNSRRCLFTNADRIRSMTDEELARFINFHTVCEECPVRDCEDACTANPNACVRNIANWLKQEIDE